MKLKRIIIKKSNNGLQFSLKNISEMEQKNILELYKNTGPW